MGSDNRCSLPVLPLSLPLALHCLLLLLVVVILLYLAVICMSQPINDSQVPPSLSPASIHIQWNKEVPLSENLFSFIFNFVDDRSSSSKLEIWIFSHCEESFFFLLFWFFSSSELVEEVVFYGIFSKRKERILFLSFSFILSFQGGKNLISLF